MTDYNGVAMPNLFTMRYGNGSYLQAQGYFPGRNEPNGPAYVFSKNTYGQGYTAGYVAGYSAGLGIGASTGYLTGQEDGMIIPLKQSTAATVSLRTIDLAGQPTSISGGQLAGAVIKLKKLGSAFSVITPTTTLRDSFIDIDLTTTHTNTLGVAELTFELIDGSIIQGRIAMLIGPLDASVSSIATDAIDAASIKADAVSEIQAGLATTIQVQNIAVTSAALNATASGATVANGTPTNTYTSTVEQDGISHQIADAAGDIDVVYDFDLSASPGAVGVGLYRRGQLQGLTNAINVYAYNWIGTAYEQIGTIEGTAAGDFAVEEFALTNSHTAAGAVRIKFAGTGLTATSLRTDRLLLGYAVAVDVSSLATSVDLADLSSRVPAALVEGRMDSSLGAIQPTMDDHIQSSVALLTAQVTAITATTVTFTNNGHMGDGAAMNTVDQTLVGMTITLHEEGENLNDGSYPQTRRINAWVSDGTTGGTATVDAWTPVPDDGNVGEGGYVVKLWPNSAAPAAAVDLSPVLDGIEALLALLHHNSIVDKQVWSGTDLVSFRLRRFADSTALLAATTGAADNADGEIKRWLGTATYSAVAKPSRFQLKEDL